MALEVNQVVEVRVAVVTGGNVDLSVGQIYEDGDWGDVVWIDLQGSGVRPLRFGDVHFVGEIYDLTLIRDGNIERPAVRLRAWRSGTGTPVDNYVLTPSGSATFNNATLLSGGSPVITDLPGLGEVENTVTITGFSDQRVGWTGHFPNPPSWFGLYIRKSVQRLGSNLPNMLTGIFGGGNTLEGFNNWLSANQPEYISPLIIGPWVIYSATDANNREWEIHQYFVSMYLSTAWSWIARRSVFKVQAGSVDFTSACHVDGAPLSFDRLWSGSALTQESTFSRTTTSDTATVSGSLTTPPEAGGEVPLSIYIAPFGVLLTLTVSPTGRVTGITMTAHEVAGWDIVASGLWGLCRPEGGQLLPW